MIGVRADERERIGVMAGTTSAEADTGVGTGIAAGTCTGVGGGAARQTLSWFPRYVVMALG